MQQTSDLDSTILRLPEQLKGCVAQLAGHYCPSQNCGCSSVGRAPPCQGGRREFEPRHPLSFCLCICGVEQPNCVGLRATKISSKPTLRASLWSYASPDASVWNWKSYAVHGAIRPRWSRNLAVASRRCRATGYSNLCVPIRSQSKSANDW